MNKRLKYLFAVLLIFSFGLISKAKKAYSLEKMIELQKKQQKDPKKLNREEKEKYLIDLWIMTECRNAYGDPFDTPYPKHSPLFRNGFTSVKNIDRYEYIKKKYKNKPWKKLKNNVNYNYVNY